MSVLEATGDLFDPAFNFYSIGHGVNCMGAMGSGIAVPFKQKYPDMYTRYKEMCDKRFLLPGMVMPHVLPGLHAPKPKVIYNIASQYKPGPDAKIEFLRAGLQWVLFHMEYAGIPSLGLPRIGAGIGGLTFDDVRDTVNEVFDKSKVTVTIVSLGE